MFLPDIIHSAFLIKGKLQNAILNGANLQKATLIEANLQAANLGGANLNGADLEKAIVTTEELNTAKSLKGATKPDVSIHP